MLKSFEKRVLRLSHASANLDWICRVHPDVRSNTKERFDKIHHKDAAERILTKLYAHVVDANMAEIINTFWKEWKMFVQETGVFSKRNMWNVRDALDGKSAEWHELYSRGRTEVLGYVGPRCTSALTGMGASERAWACTKKIMTISRGSLHGDKVERLSVVSTTYKLDKARIRQKKLEDIECSSRDAVWGDDDENVDLALEQFGMDGSKLRDMPT